MLPEEIKEFDNAWLNAVQRDIGSISRLPGLLQSLPTLAETQNLHDWLELARALRCLWLEFEVTMLCMETVDYKRVPCLHCLDPDCEIVDAWSTAEFRDIPVPVLLLVGERVPGWAECPMMTFTPIGDPNG